MRTDCVGLWDCVFIWLCNSELGTFKQSTSVWIWYSFFGKKFFFWCKQTQFGLLWSLQLAIKIWRLTALATCWKIWVIVGSSATNPLSSAKTKKARYAYPTVLKTTSSACLIKARIEKGLTSVSAKSEEVYGFLNIEVVFTNFAPDWKIQSPETRLPRQSTRKFLCSILLFKRISLKSFGNRYTEFRVVVTSVLWLSK